MLTDFIDFMKSLCGVIEWEEAIMAAGLILVLIWAL